MQGLADEEMRGDTSDGDIVLHCFYACPHELRGGKAGAYRGFPIVTVMHKYSPPNPLTH